MPSGPGCSRQRLATCDATPGCNWIVGKGCRVVATPNKKKADDKKAVDKKAKKIVAKPKKSSEKKVVSKKEKTVKPKKSEEKKVTAKKEEEKTVAKPKKSAEKKVVAGKETATYTWKIPVSFYVKTAGGERGPGLYKGPIDSGLKDLLKTTMIKSFEMAYEGHPKHEAAFRYSAKTKTITFSATVAKNITKDAVIFALSIRIGMMQHHMNYGSGKDYYAFIELDKAA